MSGRSAARVTVEVRDRFGNLVQDGTAVAWQAGPLGVLDEREPVTQGGRAQARYRTWQRYRSNTLRAYADGQVVSASVQHEPVGLVLEPSLERVTDATASFEVRLEARTASGPVSDDCVLHVNASVGALRLTEPLHDGVARAVWTRTADTPRRTKIFLYAGLGPWSAARVIPWQAGEAMEGVLAAVVRDVPPGGCVG